MKVKRENEAIVVDHREATISGNEVEITKFGPASGRSKPGPKSVVIDLMD